MVVLVDRINGLRVLRARLFPRIVAISLVALAMLAAGSAWVASARGQAQVVEVTAERFAFTPSEVRVKAGVPIEFRLRSDDTDHGFHIVGTDVRIVIPKRGRGVATVTFEPKAGRYAFECSEICGAGHGFMRGVIIAEE
jgi:cytochrome c oxidase subunit II